MPDSIDIASARAKVTELCRNGEAFRAMRACKRSGILPTLLSDVFESGMKTMYSQRRINELISFLHQYREEGISCPFNISELLQKLFEMGDHAGFLKHMGRFGLQDNFQEQIADSIKHLLDSGQVEAASAYQLRFARRGTEPDKIPPAAQHDRAADASAELCDHALTVLRRFDKGFARVKRKHCCEMSVDNAVSASVYHHGEGLRVYIHCPPDRIEALLEMAEHSQIRAVHRRDQEAIKRTRRPIMAEAYCKTEVELILPLAAFARSSRAAPSGPLKQPENAEMQPNQRDTVRPGTLLQEGARHQRVSELAERNPKARAACIAVHGTQCSVCGFDFEAAYGIIGRGFIHVHHLAPLAAAAEQRDIDPIQDLRPICPNCHSMLHRRTPPFSVTELQRIRKGFRDVPPAEEPERDVPVV
jgi:hypothetical protein